MRDLMVGIFLIAGFYIGSTGFAIVLFRIFFPLKTKSLEANKLTIVAGGNKWRPSSAKPGVQLLAVGGRKDFVKANS